MSRENPYKMISKAPLYSPANPAKQRKPRRNHPWAQYNPGFIGKSSEKKT